MTAYSLFDSQRIEPLSDGRELDSIAGQQPSAEEMAIANIQSQYFRKALGELERELPDAARVFIAHNHPGGSTAPRQLKDIAKELGITANEAARRNQRAASRLPWIIARNPKLRAYIGRGAFVEAA